MSKASEGKNENSALRESLRAQWVNFSENWCPLEQSVRTGMLDAFVLEGLGDIKGRRVVDIGCGEGRFCRLLSGLGAIVTGVDITESFIERARELGDDETYLVSDAEDLEELQDESFDLAVSYIVMVDLHDVLSAVRAAHRVLKAGGRFVVCNIHPIRSSLPTGWIKHGEKKLFYPVDNYTQEGPRTWIWDGQPFINVHRMLSTYISTFLDTGFVLTALREPTPTPEQLQVNPTFDDELRAPNFIIFELAKSPS